MPQAPITRKGYFELRRGGPEGPMVSRHTSELEAYSVAEDGDWIKPPEGWQVGIRAPFAGSMSGQNPTVLTPIGDSSFGFTAGDYSIDQNQGTVTISVTRTGLGTGALQVSWSLADGTAGSPAEYTDDSGVLNWSSGEAGVKNIVVAVTNFEESITGDKNFTCTLVKDSGNDDTGILVATVTIVDLGELLYEAVTFELGTRQNIDDFNDNSNVHEFGAINQVGGNEQFVRTKATSLKNVTPREGTYLLENYLNRGDPIPGEPAGTGCGAGQSPANPYRAMQKFLFPDHPTLSQGGHGCVFDETYIFGVSLYFPADWDPSDLYEVNIQSIQAGQNPSVFQRNPSFVVDGQEGLGGDFHIYGEYIEVFKGTNDDSESAFFTGVGSGNPAAPIREGWNDFVINWRFNPLPGGLDGFCKVWVRSSVDPWKEYVDYTGQFGCNDGPDGASGDWSEADGPISIGLYKGWKTCGNIESTGIKERTMYIDSFRAAMGTSVGKVSGPTAKVFRLVAPVGLPFI